MHLEKIKQNKILYLIIKSLSVCFVLLNIFILKNFYIGLISILLFVLLSGKDFEIIYKYKFKNIEYPYIFGIFTSIFIPLFLSSIFILFYKINAAIISINLIITFILSIIIGAKNLKVEYVKEDENDNDIKDFKLKFSYLLPIGISLFSFFILHTLISFQFKDYIVNYIWKNFNFIFFIFVFSLIAFLIYLIFSDRNKKYILLVIILASFVLHSNIPILYQKGNGGAGDRYRFLANEEILRDGDAVKPILIGDKDSIDYKNIGNIKIPEVLVSGNKQSYGNKWGIDIILSYILNKDLIQIDTWIVYILWSIFIPIIFYNLFKVFNNSNDKLALLFSASPLLLNVFQFNGSVSYPISINFIIFIFFFFLFLNKIKEKKSIDKEKIILGALITIILYFNYIVFLFIWLIFLFIYITNYFIEKIKSKKIQTGLNIVTILLSSFIFLILDIKMKFATFDFSSIFKKIIGFFIHFLSPSLIPNVNIAMPRAMFFAPILSVIFFIIVAIGIFHFFKTKKDSKYILNFFISIFLAYIYCWTILTGDRVFSRKIGIIVSLFLLFFFVYGIYYIFLKINKININKKQAIIILLGLFIASIGTLQYASGPVIELNMNYDLNSFQYVYDKVKNDEHPCVIGDTIHTILLEYISKNKLVAGGFSQTGNYVQADRSRIFNSILKEPDKKYLEEAEKITGSNNCILIADNRNIDYYHLGKDATETFINRHKVIDQLTKIFGNNKQFREIIMFYK
ncbi:MAG TPA: hypothetical protein PLM63_00895 [bacterium]|nr:hypothetical protein [bacterium]